MKKDSKYVFESFFLYESIGDKTRIAREFSAIINKSVMVPIRLEIQRNTEEKSSVRILNMHKSLRSVLIIFFIAIIFSLEIPGAVAASETGLAETGNSMDENDFSGFTDLFVGWNTKLYESRIYYVSPGWR